MPTSHPELQHRYLQLDRRALDEKTRTVPATLSTEEPVQRWNEMEVLDHSPAAVDLSRAQHGLPLLFNHDSNVPLGVAENVRLVGRTLKALLRFGRSAKAQEIFQEIADKTISGLSIGYVIHETEPMPGGYRAIKWAIYESSVTPVQADIRAGINRGKTIMENQTQTQTPQDTTRATNEQEILTREQTRRTEIRGIFDLFRDRAGVADLLNRCLDDYKINVESARQLLLTELGRDSAPLAGRHAIRSDANLQHPGEGRGLDFRTIASSGYDASQDFRQAATDALLSRNGIPVSAPHPAARDLTRMSIVDIAATCLRSAGLSTSGLSSDQILKRAFSHSSSDFPSLLANVAGKALLTGFENEPASHRIWTKNIEVADFRPQSRVRLSDAPGLLLVPELGEIKEGSFSERAASYSLKTYGRIFSISRESLLADDLQSLTRIPQAFGAAASRKESDVVYQILTSNPNMGDGEPLFSAAHNNVGTAAMLLPSSLGEARAKMRLQKDTHGGILNVTPRFLIVPAAQETNAELLLASTVDPSKANNVENAEFIRRLELVVEPRLDAVSEIAWYLAAAPSQIDTIETAYLQGQRGVFTESEEGFNVLGTRWRAVLDFAAAPLDWIGLFRNPGA